MAAILEVKNLKKHFKNNKAVANVSFSVQQGSCFGLLGPNGAGKTTTMEIIEDIIVSSGGEIFYQGRPRSSNFREEIGIQFQHTSLLNFLTVEETLKTFHKLYRQAEDLDTLIQSCELKSLLKQRNDQLSGGQQQRLMLALALINKPNILFLDEPSTGLDPQAKRNLWAIVETVLREGKTVLLTTHSMEEAEHLCDEIAIMDQGRIIAQDSPTGLINKYCEGSRIILPKTAFKMDSALIPFDWQRMGDHITLTVDQIHEALNRLLDLDVDLSAMVIKTPNLEDVFIHLTGRQLRE